MDTEPTTTFPRTDHDLLIEVSTNVKNLTQTIHGYNISNLAVTQDHETRLRDQEKRSDVLAGGFKMLKYIITILSTAVLILITYIGIKMR